MFKELECYNVNSVGIMRVRKGKHHGKSSCLEECSCYARCGVSSFRIGLVLFVLYMHVDLASYCIVCLFMRPESCRLYGLGCHFVSSLNQYNLRNKLSGHSEFFSNYRFNSDQ